MWLSIATIVLFPLPLWTSIISKKQEWIDLTMTASYAYFVIVVIMLTISVLRNCRNVIKSIDNYYSDDLLLCVKWISKSMGLLIGLSVTCGLAPTFSHYPLWLKLIFMAYSLFCYLHIYLGYRTMAVSLIERLAVCGHQISVFSHVEQSRVDSETEALSSGNMLSIQTNLEVWIAQKGYQQRGVTITDVARSVKTNRTYLSKYINSVYKASFRSWITLLRIEEAKRLLLEDSEASINKIAQTIGFASVESFTHIFTRNEGVPPTKWREKQK
ncbi:MAG: helix-turn-helix domain-containing protein [Rikenellaceae bacterium]